MEQVEVKESGSFDSFSDATPIEPNQSGDAKDSSSNLDTFDSMEVQGLPQEDEGAEKQGQDKEPKESEEPEIKRETDKLEDQEKDDDKESESKDDGKEGDDKIAKEEEQDREEDLGDKPRGKTIRVKDGDKAIDIDPEATVPVKVKGKKEFVSLAELQKNYSGQKAWSEEIASVKSEKADLQKQVEGFNQQKQEVKDHFAKIGQMMNEGFTNPEADPLGFAKHLIDLSGRDVLQFEQKLMEHYGNLANDFAQMSEAEQRLYWTERKNKILEDNQAARAKEVQQRTAQEQRQQELSQTMEKYGISEKDYKATEEELESLGYDLDQVTPDQISKWAAIKPFVNTAEEMCAQFEDDLSDADMDSLVTKTADTLYNNKSLDPLDALKISAKLLGFEITHEQEIERELEEKISEPKNKASQSSAKKYMAKDDGYESFDDYDDY